MIPLLFMFLHFFPASSAASLPGLAQEDIYCLNENMLLFNGSCHPPLSSQPCSQASSWLVLKKDSLQTSCIPRNDAEPSIQSCSHPTFDAFGAFSCDCKGSKSKFSLQNSCQGPPCPMELRDAIGTVCGRKLCCVTELIGSCDSYGGVEEICSKGADLSTFYFNLTGSYFHDYHDFYEKDFGDYAFSSGSETGFSAFINEEDHDAPSERMSLCPDGTPYPSDCPLPVCCPESENGMEMEFCEKSGYSWNKLARECIPKLYLGSKGRLLDYVLHSSRRD